MAPPDMDFLYLTPLLYRRRTLPLMPPMKQEHGHPIEMWHNFKIAGHKCQQCHNFNIIQLCPKQSTAQSGNHWYIYWAADLINTFGQPKQFWKFITYNFWLLPWNLCVQKVHSFNFQLGRKRIKLFVIGKL